MILGVRLGDLRQTQADQSIRADLREGAVDLLGRHFNGDQPQGREHRTGRRTGLQQLQDSQLPRHDLLPVEGLHRVLAEELSDTVVGEVGSGEVLTQGRDQLRVVAGGRGRAG